MFNFVSTAFFKNSASVYLVTRISRVDFFKGCEGRKSIAKREEKADLYAQHVSFSFYLYQSDSEFYLNAFWHVDLNFRNSEKKNTHFARNLKILFYVTMKCVYDAEFSCKWHGSH